MSNNSDISKDVDPKLSEEKAAEKESLVDNGVNGHSKSVENQGEVSEASDVSEQEGNDRIESEVELESESKLEVESEGEHASETGAESESKLEGEPEPEAGAENESEGEVESEARAESESEGEPEAGASESEVEIKAEAEVEPESESESEVEVESEDNEEPDVKSETGADSEPEVEAEVKVEPETETESETNTKADPKIEAESASDKDTTEAPADSKQEPPKPWEGVDFKSLPKEELVKYIELLVKENNPITSEKVARELKESYNILHEKERKQALDQFVEEGNDPDHFAYKFDELDNRFDGAFKLIRDRKTQHIKNLEQSKESNLAEKIALLETLRALVDEEETTSSIQSVKTIQEKWRTIGPVPGQHVKTLWANYHALMDRYYDQRSIYFELKELDRRKNLEAKLELCTKAEKLVDEENLKKAIGELNDLHEEFKHIGPVPKAEQQPLWERFKQASDQVYTRRKEFIKHLKEDLKENLTQKAKLADEVQQYLQFNSDRITDWNKSTKAILELQKKWESIGGLPRDQAKEVNRKFWGAFKGFFQNKGLFFKKLEGERVTNLEKKQELVKSAEALKDSTDWNATADKLKALQREWRNIGPVPEKHRNAIYSQFKDACDTFFNNRRSQNQEIEKEYIVNLEAKQKICLQIESMTTGSDFDLDKFLELKQKFAEIGYVPASQVKQIRTQFITAAKDFLAAVPEDLADEARQIKYDIEFEKLKKGPHADRRKDQKQQGLRRDISTLENDIATWKNNLEFFANSKTANKLKEEFTAKIDQAAKQLDELKSQLRALREI